MITIRLSEWERKTPKEDPRLLDVTLDTASATRAIVSRLTKERKLTILELRSGIEIHSTSFVGRVDVGNLRVTVSPKITGMPFVNLIRYSYGLRHLRLPGKTEYGPATNEFLDLLIHQLVAEVQELLSRGLACQYRPQHDLLANPRGRIDVDAVFRGTALGHAALPCRHFPRATDNLPNRVILGGLYLASRVCSSPQLALKARRLAARMQTQVTATRLRKTTLDRADLLMNRLLQAYRPAMTIIRMLFESAGIDLDNTDTAVRLPGFLFDMNKFFQALLSRFLKDHLEGYCVIDERTIAGMMAYEHGFNPKGRRDPAPRPDLVISSGNQVVAILDAKYRDLWLHSLPREMLYQLAIYSLSRPDHFTAVILHPTVDVNAREQRIEIRDPVGRNHRSEVVIRPVHLAHLESLVMMRRSEQARRLSEAYAKQLTFGE